MNNGSDRFASPNKQIVIGGQTIKLQPVLLTRELGQKIQVLPLGYCNTGNLRRFRGQIPHKIIDN